MDYIYADFMKMDYSGRLNLMTLGTFRDLKEKGIDLRPGLHICFYNEDEDSDGKSDNLVVEGIVDYDPENKIWVAEIDWDAIKNISQLSIDEKNRLGLL
jgi:hypothetical protein